MGCIVLNLLMSRRHWRCPGKEGIKEYTNKGNIKNHSAHLSSSTHTDVHTHTHTHVYTHMYTHTNVHTHTHTQNVHTHTHKRIHTHTHTHTQTYTHTYVHIHTVTHFKFYFTVFCTQVMEQSRVISTSHLHSSVKPCKLHRIIKPRLLSNIMLLYVNLWHCTHCG